MLDGRWLYVAALPLVIWIVARGRARRRAPARTLVALVAVVHVAILANVALFPIPVDPVLIAAGRAAAAAGSSGDGGLGLIPFATIGPVLAGDASPTRPGSRSSTRSCWRLPASTCPCCFDRCAPGGA